MEKRANGTTGKKRVVDDDEGGTQESLEATQPKRARTEQTENGETLIYDRRFRKGSLRRIKLHNFVTYDDCEFYPGPHLNVVIGPNGTGKSSIVCALAIGLAAKTSILGRSKEVNAFVKHGAREGFVELELWGSEEPGRVTTVIRREITKTEKSSVWKLNGKKSSKKEVEALVKKWNIQVDNLCQFLPQDRVASFAAMTPQQILRETEKAAGSENLLEWHNFLAESRNKEKNLEGTLENLGKHKADLERKNAELERQVTLFKEREALLKQISLMEKKKPWLEFEEQREIAAAAKSSKDVAQKEFEAYQKEKQGPIEKKIKELEKTLKELDAKKEEAMIETKKVEREVKNRTGELERLEQDELSLKNELTGLKDRARVREQQIEKMKKEIETWKKEVTKYPELTELDAQIEEANNQLRQSNPETNRLQTQELEIQDKLNELKQTISGRQRRLKELEDVKKAKLNHLQRDNPHAFEMWKWIEANRKQFQKQVCGPLFMEVNVPNPVHARLVEHVCPKWLVYAFVAQSQEDSQLIWKQAKDRNWTINVATITSSLDIEAQRPVPLKDLARYEIRYYLDQLIECPEIIKEALCQNGYIHTTTVGTDKTEAMIEELFETKVQNLLTPKHSYGCVRSAYGNRDASIRKDPLKVQAKNFGGVDTQEQRRLQQQLEEAMETGRGLEKQITEVRGKVEEIAKQSRSLKTEIEKIRDQKKKRLQAESKINNLTTQLKDREGEENLDEEEGAIKTKLKNLASKRYNVAALLKKEVDKCIKKVIDSEYTALARAQASVQFVNLQNEKNSFNFELDRLKRKYEELADEENRQRAKAKELKDYAESKCKLTPEIKEAFEEFPNTIEELQDLINSSRAKADMNTATNPHVVQQYEKRKQEIEELTKKLESSQSELGKIQNNTAEIKEKWTSELEKLTQQISKSFSSYFRRIGCVGEVNLLKHDDYNEWSIEIKVKFRDEDTALHSLNAQLQSGGERSVSTMLYLVSLQDLTPCPFRLVDEINQGMDPYNERMIFDVVAETACQPDRSQYFLITPKLLPDLKFTKDMTILCVFNGPWQVPQEKLKMEEFLKIKQ